MHTHDWEYFAIDRQIERSCNICHQREQVDVEEMEKKIARLEYLYGKQVYPKHKELEEALALLKEGAQALVGAVSPEIPNEIARMEYWRKWGERVRTFLNK